jgi:hypothetical protein
MMAVSTLWLAGTASADVWTMFEWFPLTRLQWQEHTLGPGRIVSLETDGGALAWRVDFESQSGADFRTKNGTLEIEVPDRCEEIHVYTEVRSHTWREARFDHLARGSTLADPPTRAELGDVPERWRAFVATGPLRAPQYHSQDPASCEAIRSRCSDVEEWMRAGGGVGTAPSGYSIGRSPPRFVPCDQADQAVERCIKGIQADEARHAEAVARHARRMRCSGLAIVTSAEDGNSISLEVVSAANDEQWARAQIELDERVDASGWVFAPLTVLVDIPFMVINAPLALVQALYGATQY